MSLTREPELVALRRLADDLARRRGEKATTAHLLAAVAASPSPAADLLRDRRLDAEVLLKAARVVTDDATDAVVRAIQRARDFAGRAGTREASGIHLLFALCHDRRSAAHRGLEQCGVDVAKLRAVAMQLAMGIATPRRYLDPRPPIPAAPASSSMPAAVRAPLPQPAPRLLSSSSPSPSSSPTPARPLPARPLPSRPAARAPSPAALTPASPPAPTATPLHAKGRRARQPAAPHTSPSPSPKPRSGSTSPVSVASKGSAAPAPSHDESRFLLDPKSFPTLHALGKNLTAAAARGELDPVVGRDEEIERALDVLAKRHANSPCLLGVAGVGKTSVVRGLAQRIAAQRDVASLDDRIVIEIEPSALLTGTGMRGALAERLGLIRAEVKRAGGRVVVFFDEIHTLFGDPSDEAASELKVALAKGEMPCIGATTAEEYRRVIEADAALARRFTPIEVVELSPEDAFVALEQVAPLFEAHHKTRYAREALAASVTWSVRYLPGKALPDKAVSILDLAGARARRRSLPEVTPEQVAEVVSELADVPTSRLLETDGDRMLRVEALLAERIVGHGKPLARIAAVLRRNASGFRSRRPIGSFLLLGPTGVGKTETAKAIAQCLFYSPDAMTRLDLSEYAEPHAIARLVGAPPGYVGHDAGGQLTEAVRRRPYQVILLDEIEKAHRDVLEAFLQVFDEGRLTDGRGRTIDFTNTVILLTSNLGSEVRAAASARGRIGFEPHRPQTLSRSSSHPVDGEEPESAYETAVIAAARAALPPELYNRLDEVLCFAPLTRRDVAEVARRMLTTLGEELEKAREVRLDVSDDAIEALLDAGGFDPELGARPMRRAIGRHVEAAIASMLLRGELVRGDVALVEAEDGRVVVDVVRPERRATGTRD